MAEKYFLLAVGILAMLMPLFGMVIGLIRYKKHGSELREKFEKQSREASEKGGIASLYFKRPAERVAKRLVTFPMVIGMLIGMLMLFWVFSRV